MKITINIPTLKPRPADNHDKRAMSLFCAARDNDTASVLRIEQAEAADADRFGINQSSAVDMLWSHARTLGSSGVWNGPLPVY